MGYAHLNDDEIVSRITQEPMQQSSEDSGVEEEIPKISHSSAVTMFEGCIQWLQQQEESSAYNITVLQELRELAAKKRLGSLKQKKITEYCTSTST